MLLPAANDNANNFANAIAAKVITPFQAVCIALVFEFLGAILVGNNVAEAIRGRIISTNLFRSNPTLLQLAMVCALCGSSIWLMLATRYAVPVSTTHSIIGAVLGVGVAAFGTSSVSRVRVRRFRCSASLRRLGPPASLRG